MAAMVSIRTQGPDHNDLCMQGPDNNGIYARTQGPDHNYNTSHTHSHNNTAALWHLVGKRTLQKEKASFLFFFFFFFVTKHKKSQLNLKKNYLNGDGMLADLMFALSGHSNTCIK